MLYKSFVLASLAAVACSLPTEQQGVIPGKSIVALDTAADVDLELHARWVSDVHTQSLARRGGESSGIDKTFSFPGFRGYSGSFDEETIEIIKANASVSLVEPELIYTIASDMALVTQSNPPWSLSAISNANPPSSSAAYTYDSTAGEGSFVYVLDSGILTTHQEFQGRAVFGIDTSERTSDKGHGTHVAAIVNGVTYGVAKKATVVDVQVLGTSFGSSSGVLAGLSWAVDDITSKNRIGKSLINMSIIGSVSTIYDNALQAAIDTGIPIVVAAGNSNLDAAGNSPANQPNVIAVAASNRDYRRWTHSNWGTVVDIFAPGESITSAYPPSNNGTYTTSGTSQAAPHVAGVIAYLFALEGPRTPAEIWVRLQELAIKDIITDTKDVPNLLLYNGSGN